MKLKLITTFLLAFSLFLAACGPTATPAPEPTEVPAEPTEMPVEEEMAPSIAEIAAGDENFSTLVAALDAAGLVETLAGEGEFTVFAPTNDAFAALPEGAVEALLEDPNGPLTDILRYHVVEGTLMSEGVVTLEAAMTVQGEVITIEVTDAGVVLNGMALVTAVDIEASNGVIHVIDAVLLPPSLVEMPSIAEIAAGDENFSTLVTALDAAGLVETLAGEGEFTVFAPTNDAFAALPEGTVEALLEDPGGALNDILRYHVVGGAVTSDVVVTLESAMTLQGEDITIEVTDDGVLLNGAVMVTAVDIEASNGVIHVIDAVLMPPSMTDAEDDDMMMEEPTMTIAEIAAGDENFSTLVAALDAADLVETFAGEGEFTVFAPTNDAFDALPEGTLDALLADPTGDLTTILRYHVVGAVVPDADVVELESAMTLQEEEITIEVTDSGVVLNGVVNVIMTDIMATNGVIHVIDMVLLPPSMGGNAEADMVELVTIAEVASTSPDFETLTAALTAANLVDLFADAEAGPFTVFAPTDEAFDALPDGVLEELLADPEGALLQVLQYHVVEGAVDAETVVGLDAAMTQLGEEITIMVDEDGNVILNDSVMVIFADVQASNGIIHVIDAVLVP